jgi:nitrogen regulatory protein PII
MKQVETVIKHFKLDDEKKILTKVLAVKKGTLRYTGGKSMR